MSEKWRLTFRVHRKKGDSPSYYDEFSLEVNPDEYVLDPVERIWAFEDRSLVYAHACHHSTCGACGMRVNGVEKLTCITTVRDVVRDGETLQLDPLRHFPIVSDLVVDMGGFYGLMDTVGALQIYPVNSAPLEKGIQPQPNGADASESMSRLSDCIECGLCISACPIVGTSSSYLGPAVLAEVQRLGLEAEPSLLGLVDHQDGAWRCHGIHECTEVCPSAVEPAWRIMALRKEIFKNRFSRIFRRS